MGWLVPRSGRFTPGRDTRYPLYRRPGGPQGRSGRLREISPPPGFDHRTVQAVASRYTDCAIPAHVDIVCTAKLNYEIDNRVQYVNSYSDRNVIDSSCSVLKDSSAAKERNSTSFECGSVALVIQHAKRMRRLILSSVDSLGLPY
jgi:hypothetical protein